MKTFTAILHKGEAEEGGYWATCLEVSGANGQGETREECLANLSTAVRDLLEANWKEAIKRDPNAEQVELLVSPNLPPPSARDKTLARKAAQARKKIRLITCGGNGLRPGVNLDSSADLLRLMEESGK